MVAMLVPTALPCTEQALQEWRCVTCNRLLALVRLPPGATVQVKCGRCGRINALST